MDRWIPEGLRTILGNDLSAVTAGGLDRLVGAGVSERTDLEFKSRQWNSGCSGNVELAQDLAQFANTSGGLLIVGGAEDKKEEHDKLAKLEPLSRTTDLRSRIENVANTRVFPQICPEVSLVDYNGGVVVLISVPPSTSRPHAVREANGRSYSYPRRSGSRRFYMAESEIAAEYRGQFDRAGRLRASLKRVLDEAELVATKAPSRLRYGGVSAKLIVGSVSEASGKLEMDKALLESYSEWIRDGFTWFPPLRRRIDWNEATPGLQSVRFGTRPERRELFGVAGSDIHGACFNLDGSGWVMFDITSYTSSNRSSSPSSTVVRFRTLVLALFLVSSLRLLAEHAARSGGSGLISFGSQIVAGGNQEAGIAVDAPPIRRFLPDDYIRIDGQTTPVSWLSYPEPLLGVGQGLLRAARLVGNDILGEFEIMETPDITSDHELIVSRVDSKTRDRVASWAKEHGILVLE